MRILALVAGTNVPSNAELLCDAFLDGIRLECADVAISKLALRELSIEHFKIIYYHPQCPSEDDFCALQSLVEEADGIVIASPVWNFSVPAHLKNVIDRMGAFCLDEATRTRGKLKGTPAYFLFTGGSPNAAWKGLMRFTTSHVHESLRYYGASIIGRIYEGRCTPKKGEFGLVLDTRPLALERARRAGRSYGVIVRNFAKHRLLPLRHRIMQKLYRGAQRFVAKFL